MSNHRHDGTADSVAIATLHLDQPSLLFYVGRCPIERPSHDKELARLPPRKFVRAVEAEMTGR